MVVFLATGKLQAGSEAAAAAAAPNNNNDNTDMLRVQPAMATFPNAC